MIRSATVDDVATIARLIRALAEYERLSDRAIFDEEKLREHLFGERRYAEVLLAEQEGKVVGFALYFHNYSTFQGKPGLYLEDLFVLPDFRGKGVGKSLLVALAKLAVERGCGSVRWVVLKWNEPSIRFYESLGAMAMNEWTEYRLLGDPLKKVAALEVGPRAAEE